MERMPLQSDIIYRGVISGQLESSVPIRTVADYGLNKRNCWKCGKVTFAGTIGNEITVTGVSGFCASYCWECAGFSVKESFNQREKWIREGLHFTSETPRNVIADWLEEFQGRTADAEYLRALDRPVQTSGAVRVGG